jgi:hypothetical protein
MYSCSNMSSLLLVVLVKKGVSDSQQQRIRTYATQAEHKSLLSHLQLLGSFKHKEHCTASDAHIDVYYSPVFAFIHCTYIRAILSSRHLGLGL